MFITWQRAVGGRLKSDLRVSNTLTWSTFPLPDVTAAAREAICEAGRQVLAARELHPGRSLAQHYNPLAMDPELLRAHRALDKFIDRAFGLTGKVDESARLSALFASYARLVEAERLPISKSKARRAS